MPEGWIVKALSGYYYVSADLNGSSPVQCRARGIFKKRGITPLVGDRVAYEWTENGEGTVTEVFPRISELIRPPVANVRLAVLVFAVAEPALNFQLLDKFLVHAEHAGLEPILCLTKQDLLESERLPESSREQLQDRIRVYETIGYEVYWTSSLGGKGLSSLRSRLAGSISVFAGQSGVGKSSLLNALVPGLSLETNAISNKLGRGKHTTRHVELIPLPEGGAVADTPGFSQLDFAGIEAEDLAACFKEFRTYSAGCKFRGCQHRQEPGCMVRAALEEGKIAATRYGHYVQFLDEMKDKKRRY
jgi:ribosome biogenesis GTPase